MKCMVKESGSLTEYSLNLLDSRLELNRTVIVTGYEGAKLRKHVGCKWNGMRIDYVDKAASG